MTHTRIIMPVGTSILEKFYLDSHYTDWVPEKWREFYDSDWQKMSFTEKNELQDPPLPKHADRESLNRYWSDTQKKFRRCYEKRSSEGREKLPAELASLQVLCDSNLISVPGQNDHWTIELWASDSREGMWAGLWIIELLEDLKGKLWGKDTREPIIILRCLCGVQPYDVKQFVKLGQHTLHEMTHEALDGFADGSGYLIFNLTGGMKAAQLPVLFAIRQTIEKDQAVNGLAREGRLLIVNLHEQSDALIVYDFELSSDASDKVSATDSNASSGTKESPYTPDYNSRVKMGGMRR